MKVFKMNDYDWWLAPDRQEMGELKFQHDHNRTTTVRVNRILTPTKERSDDPRRNQVYDLPMLERIRRRGKEEG